MFMKMRELVSHGTDRRIRIRMIDTQRDLFPPAPVGMGVWDSFTSGSVCSPWVCFAVVVGYPTPADSTA